MAQIKASELEQGIDLQRERFRDRRRKRNLQKRELRKITNFFIIANSVMAGGVLLLALIDHFNPLGRPVITERVIIAAIAGTALQSGAIILAAFRGLFSK